MLQKLIEGVVRLSRFLVEFFADGLKITFLVLLYVQICPYLIGQGLLLNILGISITEIQITLQQSYNLAKRSMII